MRRCADAAFYADAPGLGKPARAVRYNVGCPCMEVHEMPEPTELRVGQSAWSLTVPDDVLERSLPDLPRPACRERLRA